LQPNLRRWKIIALAVALFFSVAAVVEVFVREKFGDHPTPIDSDLLALLKTILIFMSVYGLVAVVASQFWRVALLNRFSTRRSRFSPEAAFFVINYPWLVAPTVYGQLLYYCGISLRESFYFIGTSIVMTLAWAIYDLRKT
jgi:hypothetical protein